MKIFTLGKTGEQVQKESSVEINTEMKDLGLVIKDVRAKLY